MKYSEFHCDIKASGWCAGLSVDDTGNFLCTDLNGWLALRHFLKEVHFLENKPRGYRARHGLPVLKKRGRVLLLGNPPWSERLLDYFPRPLTKQDEREAAAWIAEILGHPGKRIRVTTALRYIAQRISDQNQK